MTGVQTCALPIYAGVALGGHSLEVRVEHRIERRFTFGYIDYVRGGVSLTWSYGGFHVSPIIRWDTERKDLDSTLYLAGEARWEFVEGSHVRLFGGRTPGGRLCSGGICRDVPPFEGVLLELVIRI